MTAEGKPVRLKLRRVTSFYATSMSGWLASSKCAPSAPISHFAELRKRYSGLANCGSVAKARAWVTHSGSG
jgi:hypothetical protein